MRPLLTLSLILAALPAAAVPTCDNPASLLQAVEMGLATYLAGDKCVNPAALQQFNTLYPDLPADWLQRLSESAQEDGSVKALGRLKPKEEEPKKKGKGKKRGRDDEGAMGEARPEGAPGNAPAPSDGTAGGENPEKPKLDPRLMAVLAHHMRKAIKEGRVKAECGTTPGSANWSHDPNCKEDVCGTMDFNESKVNMLTRDGTPYNQIMLQEQLANSIVHELAHAFSSFIKNTSGVDPVQGSCKLDIDFRYSKHWNGCKMSDYVTVDRFATPGYKLSGQAYANNCSENAARQIAHRLHLCGGASVGQILSMESGGCGSSTRPRAGSLNVDTKRYGGF